MADNMIWSQITRDTSGKVHASKNTSSTTDKSNISSTSGTGTKEGNATLDVNEFLNLLVTQMKYQDPLEPTDNTQYVAQMAVFTQVEATTQMQAKTEEQMASNLVGTEVMMKTDQNADGYIVGKVEYWKKLEGKSYLGINSKLYDLSDLDTVMDDEYYKKYSAINGDSTVKKPTGIQATVDNTSDEV